MHINAAARGLTIEASPLLISIIFRIFRMVYSRFKDNIWGADFADMEIISKLNKGFRFLLCIIDIVSKYVWVVPLKDKKVLQLLMLFRKF